MRVNVISDVHGRTDGLAEAADGADALVCLGDLLAILDYHDYGSGVFAELFGVEDVTRFIELRRAKRFHEASAMLARLWSRLEETTGSPAREQIERTVRHQYDTLFAAMPAPAYLTYGNVDWPLLWRDYARPGHRVLDGETVEIGGRTFGFVGGGLPSAYHSPHEVDEETYAAAVASLGAVDVLCCHIPPDVPDLTYDIVARRFERGSEATLDAVRDTQPKYALFGHVHQPLTSRTRVGKTECVNVGHFRVTGKPYVLEF